MLMGTWEVSVKSVFKGNIGTTDAEKEYDEVVNFAVSIGVENGFLQEGGTVSESFIPKFDGTGVSRFSNPSSRDISGNS